MATTRSSWPCRVTRLLAAVVLLLAVLPGLGQKQARRRTETGLISMTPTELLGHLEAWTVDVAVLFYAPWCPYCKMVGPFWDMVGQWHAEQNTQGMVLARFDCEQDLDAAQICEYLGVERYPLLQFFGYGSYYQNDPLSTLIKRRRSNVDRSTRFEGPYDPEVMKDWTNMMAGVSTWHRRTEGLWSFFGWGPKPVDQATARALKAEVETLKEENRWLKKAGGLVDSSTWGSAQAAPSVEEPSSFAAEDFEQQWAESANEMLGEALGSGDPYVELARGSLSPTQERAVLACLAEFAGDYCLDHASGTVGIGAEEPYCDILEGCSRTGFAGEACRPAKCPFTTPEGCERVRTCLRSGVMELYLQMVSPEVSVPTKVPASGAGANPDGASDME